MEIRTCRRTHRRSETYLSSWNSDSPLSSARAVADGDPEDSFLKRSSVADEFTRECPVLNEARSLTNCDVIEFVGDVRGTSSAAAHPQRQRSGVHRRRSEGLTECSGGGAASISDDEVSRILAAAAGGDECFGFTGADRRMLYVVALSTGLRASELASLTSESLRLMVSAHHRHS